MQGTIAQIVALTVHGNSILQKASTAESLEFQNTNSTFKFCESIKFIDVIPGLLTRRENVCAATPYDWFECLRKEKVHGLRVSYGPSGGRKIADRMLVGFVGGGGKWLIETCGPETSDYWKVRWQVGDRESKGKKIWRVSYFRVLRREPSGQGQQENLQKLKIQLSQCLEDIAPFSRSHNLDWFTKAFESGIARLESEAPLEGLFHEDIAPTGFLSLQASQLLGSAGAAWGFGGMGSWNDQGFEGPAQARNEQLSEQLYQLLNRVIVAAANSSLSCDATRTA